MDDTDAQKKEVDKPEEEPLEDLTPEKDAIGGAGFNPDAQKKEIGEA
ncbi:MAG: hypothetical protein ABI992_11365 [Chthoniobacterales bacterium]